MAIFKAHRQSWLCWRLILERPPLIIRRLGNHPSIRVALEAVDEAIHHSAFLDLDDIAFRRVLIRPPTPTTSFLQISFFHDRDLVASQS